MSFQMFRTEGRTSHLSTFRDLPRHFLSSETLPRSFFDLLSHLQLPEKSCTVGRQG